ncbi:hypothetical protein [Streptomyces sp. WZ-12]|uniref:hypothetical protein n=1 Tax=Streptomyces sp. WZ-12 TaxID=3030210 RepID=UPI002381414B|nr:hypothetical protein [Streptomyces sp. WZ-12]
MQFTDLQALLDRHTTGGTLTLAGSDFGHGPAAALVNTWLDDKTLTLGTLHRTDHPDTNTIVVDGELGALGITDAQVTGIEFGLDPVDQDPTLFIPLPTPASWTIATSFPDTEGSDLSGLTFGDRRPELLLTSVPRPARDGRPVLDRGLTFHAPEVQDPTPLGPLVALVRRPPASLSLTGLVQRRSVGETVVTDVALRSIPEPPQGFGGDFFLWAGSRGDAPPLTYGLRLAADLVLAHGVGATISAPVPAPGNEIALTVDALPGDVGTDALAEWYGTGLAVQQLTTAGFPLGDAVRLTGLSATIDVTKIGTGPDKGLVKALTAIAVKVAAQPAVSWPIVGDDLAVTGVGAHLTVTTPLQKSRSATVTGYGDFTVAGAVALHASAAIPPGRFELALDDETPAQLKDVLRHFVPGTDLSGVPDLTLRKFHGTATPTQGEYGLSAAVTTDWHLDLGASRLQLTETSLELDRKREEGEKGEKEVVKRRGVWKTWRSPQPGAAESQSLSTTGTLAAKATLGPASGGNDGILFDAAWHLPGTFEIGGTFPKIDLTALIDALACRADVPLPDGLPAVELSDSTVRLRLGGAGVGEVADGQGYELAVASTVAFAGAHALTLVGKAAKGDSGTLFAAAFWQQDWAWSPRQIPGWSEALGILGDITFAKSGLAVCSADGVALDAASPPDTLPGTLDKGLTFFTEIGFTGPLDPLRALFDGVATGVHLQAVLTSPVKNSVFKASIAEQKLRPGFGGLEVEIKPALPSITLSTSWNLTVPAMGSAPETLLQFVAGGTVSRAGFSLSLTLKPAAPALGTIAGQLAPGRYAFALEKPGRTALPAVPLTDPDGRIVHDATRRPTPEVGAPQPGPAWKNAFGIEGFDVEAFWAQIGGGTSGLTLGMGGSIRVGEVHLELDIVGGLEPEPFVTVFRFALTTADKGKGVSVRDILAVVVTPPPALDFLKTIVLHELTFCAVTAPGGWDSPLGEHWEQGYYGRGDIDFFGNNWRFEVGVGNDGIYASSVVAQPLALGGVFTFSNHDGSKGPQYLLDTRGIKEGHLPEKIFYLSGKIDLLGITSAAVEAELGAKGFAFTLDAHLLDILTSELRCTLNTDGGLHASANVGLDFRVDIPRGVLLGGIPIPGGTLVDIQAHGGFDLTIDGSGAQLHLEAGCDAYLAGVHLVTFDLNIDFGIRSWDGIVGYLQDHPEELFAALGSGIWDAMKDCATTRAAELT